MKTTLKNRIGQNIVAIVDEPNNSNGLAFVMHGLGGFKEQPHIEAMAEAFFEGGYTAVRFDTTNTFGESDGDYADATTTNYYNDLEDVISWAKTQSFYHEPFILAGHSLGGISTALYAEKHPEEVKGLAPISTVVSGELSLQSPQYKDNDTLEQWKKTGIRETPSESVPGLIKRLKYSHIEDRLKYDLLPDASKLTMPVLMVVGEEDDSTPAEHQKMLLDKVPGKKELHIIKGSPHTFRAKEHVAELKEIFKNWLVNL